MSDAAKKLGIDLEEMIPDLVAQVSNGLRERAISSLQYEATRAVQEAVKQHIEEKVIPSMREELAKLDAEIRAAFVEAVRAAVQAVAVKTVESTTAKIAGYEGDAMVRGFLKLMTGSPY